jgi:hypothetical protein
MDTIRRIVKYSPLLLRILSHNQMCGFNEKDNPNMQNFSPPLLGKIKLGNTAITDTPFHRWFQFD